MSAPSSPQGFLATLEYILNDSTIREIDALEAAVTRRKADLAGSTGIISLDPEKAAKQMSGAIEATIQQSMEGVRGTFREFAADLLMKEAPELSREDMLSLIDRWMPASNPQPTPSKNGNSLSKNGSVNGIPSEAMYEMICQFVEYSSGRMALRDQQALRDEIGDWVEVYWKKFPAPVQEAIRDFLKEKIDGAEFDARLSVLLGG